MVASFIVSQSLAVTHGTCKSGYFDADYPANNCSDPSVNCAKYTGDFIDPRGDVWLLVMGGITMALMAFGIGGNDVANSWATSVGSGAISLGRACVIAGGMNWLGAISLGYGVSSKITKGVAKTTTPECWACGYCNSMMSVYAIGMFGSLVGGAMFLLIAIKLKLPVSTTHAIVGGVVGVTALGLGTECLNFEFPNGLGGIGASWLISPIPSGIIGCVMYGLTNWTIFKRETPRKAALLALPTLFAVTAFVMIFLVLIKAGPTRALGKGFITLYAVCGAASIFVAVWFGLRPYVMKYLPSHNIPKTTVVSGDRTEPRDENNSRERSSSASRIGKDAHECSRDHLAALAQKELIALTVEEADAMYVFRYLLVFIAACESFAHGANDTANSTAAFSKLVNIYTNGIYACGKQSTPIWIMAIAGGFVMLGICTVGHRVILRIGKELTAINFQRGFCIEFGSTMSIIIATVLEMPVSTTHCQIGAVFFVGLMSFGWREVQWNLMARIVLSWLFTIPVAGVISGVLTVSGGFWMMDYRNNAAFNNYSCP